MDEPQTLREFLTALGKDGLEYAYSALQSFALWLTVALVAILAVTFTVLYFVKKDKLQYFKTLALGIIIGYAITLTACISLFMIARLSVKSEINKDYYLMLGFFAIVLVYALAAIIVSPIGKKPALICHITGISVLVIYSVVLLFTLSNLGGDYEPLSETGMYIFTALLVVVIALAAIFGKDKGSATPTKALAYAGLCIALSFALSYIKLFSLPQGGSVTLASMLPLIIYSYVFGARKGVLAGFIYGILQCIQSPQIYHPLQVLIDYPIAFSAIGIAGIARSFNFTKNPVVKFIIGASLAVLGRYFAHVISGYYVFSSWAMEGYSALGWALVYNMFLIAELAIILLVGSFLFSSKNFVKELEKINPVTNMKYDAVIETASVTEQIEKENSNEANGSGNNGQ